MKHTIKIAGLALAIVFGAATAQAQDIKPYVGVGLGMFTTDYGSSIDTPYSFGGFLKAGADFNEYIGAELRIGSVSSSNVEVSGVTIPGVTSKVDWFISYLAKPQFQLSKEVRIYGLIGATTGKITVSLAGLGSGSATKTMLSFGGGLEFEFADGISAGIEYVQYTNNADGVNDKAKVTGISATANFEF